MNEINILNQEIEVLLSIANRTTLEGCRAQLRQQIMSKLIKIIQIKETMKKV